jgi:hypothetical protein
MGCSAFFFSTTTPLLYNFQPSSCLHTPLQQAHASNVSCLSFRLITHSTRDCDDSAAAATLPLLLASGGADHCVRMHSIALH